jgi:hypothetical protein
MKESLEPDKAEGTNCEKHGGKRVTGASQLQPIPRHTSTKQHPQPIGQTHHTTPRASYGKALNLDPDDYVSMLELF